MLEIHVCNQQGDVLRAFALGDSDEVIIGRDETCDIRIRAKTVSREHCTVEREGQDFVLRDLGSTSGIFLTKPPRRGIAVPYLWERSTRVSPGLLLPS